MKSRILFALVVVVSVCSVIITVSAENGQKQKLYVLSSVTDQAYIIDPATNEITGAIAVGGQPHGLAIPESQDVVYFVTEADNKIVVVDPVTDEILGKYPVGDTPNEPDITPDGKFVYVPARHEGVYEVWDTEKKEIVARIRTKGLPHNAVASPDGRFMYLSPQGDNDMIYVADTKTHTVHATIDTTYGPRPIAVSPDGKWLYVNTDNLLGFKVLDLENYTVAAVAEYELTDKEKAEKSRSHGVVATPDGKEVWSSDVNHELVFVFDVTQMPPKQIARFENPGDPYWMTVTPDGKTVYVASATDDTVAVYDVASKTLAKVINLPKGEAPKRMQIVTLPAAQ